MADDPLCAGDAYNDGLGVHIKWQAHSHHLSFSAKEGTKQDDGRWVYTYFPSNASEPTWDFWQGERWVDGDVKWDGCSHLRFGEREDNPGYVHVCGAPSFAAMLWTLRTVFSLAERHVPHWSTEVAGSIPASETPTEE
jgi:hypothetical protein